MRLKLIIFVSVFLLWPIASMAQILVLNPKNLTSKKSDAYKIREKKYKDNRLVSIFNNETEIFQIVDIYLSQWNQLVYEAKRLNAKIVYKQSDLNHDYYTAKDFESKFRIVNFISAASSDLKLEKHKAFLTNYYCVIYNGGNTFKSTEYRFRITKSLYQHLNMKKLEAAQAQLLMLIDSSLFERELEKIHKKTKRRLDYRDFVTLGKG